MQPVAIMSRRFCVLLALLLLLLLPHAAHPAVHAATLQRNDFFQNQQQHQSRNWQAQQLQQQDDATTEVVENTTPMTDQQELQNLRQIIVSWRELESEVSTLSAQIREKNKRKKALDEMILRIMNKHNIGALDLKGSGGRLLLRKKTTKAA